jgi:flagellar biosynthesis protein FlhF
MRQALRAVREQLGEDAVILSSRKTGEGVEVTAAVDFDAATLEGSGFANAPEPLPPPRFIDATPVPMDTPVAAAPRGSRQLAIAPPVAGRPHAQTSAATRPAAAQTAESRSQGSAATRSLVAHGAGQDAHLPDTLGPAATRLTGAQNAESRSLGAAATHSLAAQSTAKDARSPAAFGTAATRTATAQTATRPSGGLNATAIALTTGRAPPPPAPLAAAARIAVANTSYHELAAVEQPEDYDGGVTFTSHAARYAAYEADLISEAAREAVVEHMATERAPVLEPAPMQAAPARARLASTIPAQAASYEDISDGRHAAPAHAAAAHATAANAATAHATMARAAVADATSPRVAAQRAASYEHIAADEHDPIECDPVEEIREATLTPLASNEVKAAFAELKATGPAAPAATEAMSDELKTLRRMLENQLAHLAWNDLTRRAPVHTEILRELTEIGISHDLAEHLVRQLPEDQDLTFARRFTIAGLSQYLKVTGDRWLDDGGRVAFVGSTGVGKTTTLAKIAVRWVLRHGARDIALVAADPVRIGAHDQLRSLAQLLGVPVYTPESFDHLPALLSRLGERLILIDTPGSSARDSQLAGRLAVLSNSASKLETALVLAASTQAGSIEETVRRFASANPSCCVLTKLDEAASLGGVLSALIRARMPVSYMSEGQRVPEDLRPARALELVSAAVRLAKARGAAADEDLLRRRFGKNAHGIS